MQAERDDFARRLDRRINEIFSLQELSYVLSESLQTERIVEQVARFTARFLEAEGTLVVLASEDQPTLRVAAAEGTLASLRGRSVPSDQGGLLTQAIGRERIELAEGPPPGVELDRRRPRVTDRRGTAPGPRHDARRHGGGGPA